MRLKELQKNDIIIVESSTNDGGQTNNPDGWYNARLDWGSCKKRKISITDRKAKCNNKTIADLYKIGKAIIVDGGWANGKLKSTITYLRIV